MDRAEAINTLIALAVCSVGGLSCGEDCPVKDKCWNKKSGDAWTEDGVRDAVHFLREQEQSEWISVKDDYPKRIKRYFIAYQFEGSDMRFYGEAMFHPEGGNGCVDRPHFSNEGVDGMYVTHWMEIPKLPLPEPPKEGAEG